MDQNIRRPDSHSDEINPGCSYVRSKSLDLSTFGSVYRINRISETRRSPHFDRHLLWAVEGEKVEFSPTDFHVGVDDG